jgi:hypothetical protein
MSRSLGLTIQRLPSSCICLLSASGSELHNWFRGSALPPPLVICLKKLYDSSCPLPRLPSPLPRARRSSRFVTANTITSLLTIRFPDGTEGVMPYNALLLNASVWCSNRSSHKHISYLSRTRLVLHSPHGQWQSRPHIW